jgi:hypothetical protein
MSAPNPDDPLDNQVAEQWKTNEVAAMATGRESSVNTFIYIYICSALANIQFYQCVLVVAREWTRLYAK